MAAFVLVHGANLGGWCWRLVTPSLRYAGHDVYAPSLTGCGDRSRLLSSGVGLETWVEDIVNLMYYEDLDNVVLVGHASGAMVAVGAADRSPGRIARLVSVDGFIPRDGESSWEVLPEDIRSLAEKQLAAIGETWKSPPAPVEGWLELARAEGWNEIIARWAAARAGWHPLKPDHDRISLKGGEAFDKLPRTFLRCAASTDTRLDAAARARELGWPVVDIPAAHLVMFSQPQVLVDALLRIAEPYGA